MAEGKGGMMHKVLQKVSRVFNRGLMRKDSSKEKELDADSDFDPEDEDLPLSIKENLLGRRDSRCIMFAAWTKEYSFIDRFDLGTLELQFPQGVSSSCYDSKCGAPKGFE